MELRQLGTDRIFDLDNSKVTIGRSRETGISNKKVSRCHCVVEQQGDGQCAHVKALRKSWVEKEEGLEALEAGESTKV